MSMPAIPPRDYEGTIACWITELLKRGWMKGQNEWYGDIELSDDDYEELLDYCESQ